MKVSGGAWRWVESMKLREYDNWGTWSRRVGRGQRGRLMNSPKFKWKTFRKILTKGAINKTKTQHFYDLAYFLFRCIIVKSSFRLCDWNWKDIVCRGVTREPACRKHFIMSGTTLIRDSVAAPSKNLRFWIRTVVTAVLSVAGGIISVFFIFFMTGGLISVNFYGWRNYVCKFFLWLEDLLP